ncbi:MAG: hypothetical protein JST00_32820 [Deltaproteobacteria bacterium]|nr:hypothetical protein [Deltaproteobacteria bacterium]
MMKRATSTLRALTPVSLAVTLLSGCTLGSSSQSPQSHFAYPNSNVIPMGEARGSHSRLCGLLIFNWGAPDGDDQEAATKEALERANADILINVRTDSAQQIIPMLINICKVSVRGTAAKMEVGRQQLSAINTAAAAPLPPPPRVPVAAPVPPPPPLQGSPGASCVRDTECAGDDQVCERGQCASVHKSPNGCTRDTDCKAGRQCSNGSCVSKP